MSVYNIIKLRNITPLHISIGKDFYDTMYDDVLSDMLSAAVASIRVSQKGKTDDVEQFMNSFNLSSAFPFIGEDLYLPKPMGRISIGIAEEHRKKLKKIKYIEKSLFERLYIKGEKVEADKGQMIDDLLLNGVSDTKHFYKKQEVERVAIPRNEGVDAVPYFYELKYFSTNAGLYCITDAKGELFEELVDLFGRLGQEGVGSVKNIGCGHFDVETGRIELSDVVSSDRLMLSMYIPTREELQSIDLEKSAYRMVLRGGYMAGSDNEARRQSLKRAVYMFESSSIIHCEEPLEGRVVNLSNNYSSHNIYRSGKAFSIPIIKQEQI